MSDSTYQETWTCQMEMEREEILTVLRTLMERASSPVIRECLREACADIAYLTSTGDEADAEAMEDSVIVVEASEDHR